MPTPSLIRSILYGVAVGDALGVPVEFTSREQLRQKPLVDMIGFGAHQQPAGTWSDDSTMTFCLAESIATGYAADDLAQRFVRWVDEAYWTPHGEVFDIGITTRAAIAQLAEGVSPRQSGETAERSNGNGALMRILPLLLLWDRQPGEADRFVLVQEVAAITHAHPRSAIACYHYLHVADALRQDATPAEAYRHANALLLEQWPRLALPEAERPHFDRILDGKLAALEEADVRGSGYVIHSLEASLWCLLRTRSYAEAVLLAINLGEDTDTTGAITGGLAALHYGYDAIPRPWVEALARRADIEDLCQRLQRALTTPA
jgi:ADP-ribosylglycohydrolase